MLYGSIEGFQCLSGKSSAALVAYGNGNNYRESVRNSAESSLYIQSVKASLDKQQVYSTTDKSVNLLTICFCHILKRIWSESRIGSIRR